MGANIAALLEAAKARVSLCPHWDTNTCVGSSCPEVDLCDGVRIAGKLNQELDSVIVTKARLWYEAQKRFQAAVALEKGGPKRSPSTSDFWDEAGIRLKELVAAIEA